MELLQQLPAFLRSKQSLYGLIVLLALSLSTWLWRHGIFWLTLISILCCLSVGLVLWFAYRYYRAKQVKHEKSGFALFNQLFKQRFDVIKAQGWRKGFLRASTEEDIPWLIVLGAEASGKSSLIDQSGLNFVDIGEQKQLDASIIQESDLCQWHFSDKAVVIEPSALMMEGEQQDVAWNALFKRFKKRRLQRHIQGMILSIDGTLLMDKDIVGSQLKRLRRRVDEIYQACGRRLPIQVVITHLDELPGFQAFFDAISGTSLAQLGFTVGEQESFIEAYKQYSDILYQGLAQRLSLRLSYLAEKDRLSATQFPFLFHQWSEALTGIMNAFCQDNRYQEGLFIRGLSYTALPSIQGKVKPFFVSELFEQVISTAKSQPLWTKKQLHKRQWSHRGLQGAIIAPAALGIICSVQSFVYDYTLSQSGLLLTKQTIQSMEQKPLSSDFATLQALGKHYHELINYSQQVPWYHRMGLYRGNQALPVFDDLLKMAMKRQFEVPIRQKLAKNLQNMHVRWRTLANEDKRKYRADYYGSLKAYLSLSYPQFVDQNSLPSFLSHQWYDLRQQQGQKQVSKNDIYHLTQYYLEHLNAMSAEARRKQPEPNEAIVVRARHDLVTASGMANRYAELMQTSVNRYGVWGTDQLLDDAGMDMWISHKKLPKIYTKEGFQKYFLPILNQMIQNDPHHDWVIHVPIAKLSKSNPQGLNHIATSQQQILARKELVGWYFADYYSHWTQFLNQLEMVKFSSIEDASEQVRTLEAKDGPLAQLLKHIQGNMAINTWLSRKTLAVLPEMVKSRFDEIAKLLDDSQGTNQALDEYYQSLQLTRQFLERLALQDDGGMLAHQASLSLLNGKSQESELYKGMLVTDKLTNEITHPRMRVALHHVFISPTKEAYRSVLDAGLELVATAWQNQVVNYYHDVLMPYFPFSEHGADLSLAQLNAFFKPDSGIVDQFVNQNLAGYLHASGSHWQIRKWLGIGPSFSQNFLNSLIQLKQLTSHMYSNQALNVAYAMYPIPTPDVKEILFTSNGKSYPYRNGPQEWVQFSWPGQDSIENETLLRVTESHSDRHLGLEYQGVWGIFHMIKRADSRVMLEKGMKLTWSLSNGGQTKKIQAIIRFDGENNPIKQLLAGIKPLPKFIV